MGYRGWQQINRLTLKLHSVLSDTSGGNEPPGYVKCLEFLEL